MMIGSAIDGSPFLNSKNASSLLLAPTSPPTATTEVKEAPKATLPLSSTSSSLNPCSPARSKRSATKTPTAATNKKTTTAIDNVFNWSLIQQQQPKQNRNKIDQRSRPFWHSSVEETTTTTAMLQQKEKDYYHYSNEDDDDDDRKRMQSALLDDHVVQQPIMTIQQQHGPNRVTLVQPKVKEGGKYEKASFSYSSSFFLLDKFQQKQRQQHHTIEPVEVCITTAPTTTKRTINIGEEERQKQQVHSHLNDDGNDDHQHHPLHSTLNCLRMRSTLEHDHHQQAKSLPLPLKEKNIQQINSIKSRPQDCCCDKLFHCDSIIKNISKKEDSTKAKIITATVDPSSLFHSEVVATTNNNNDNSVGDSSSLLISSSSRQYSNSNNNDDQLNNPIVDHYQHQKIQKIKNKKTEKFPDQKRKKKINHHHHHHHNYHNSYPSTTFKWTKDSIFWLRFWSQQRQRKHRHRLLLKTSLSSSPNNPINDVINKSSNKSSKSDSNSTYSYCYYNFFYYPFRSIDSNNKIVNNRKYENDTKFKNLSRKSSSLITLIPSSSSTSQKLVDSGFNFTPSSSSSSLTSIVNQDCPLLCSSSSSSFSSKSLDCNNRSCNNTNYTDNLVVVSKDNHIDNINNKANRDFLPKSNESVLSFEEYYNCDKRYLEDNTNNNNNNSNSNTTICLSTIMEILPLILLLTMGVIISTTCAKYTFQSSSSTTGANSAAHHHHIMFHSMDAPIIATANSKINQKNSTTSSSNETNNSQDHLNLMMSDEEGSPPSNSENESGGRPRYASFHGSLSYPSSSQQQQHYHHLHNLNMEHGVPTKSTSPSSTSQQQLFAQLAHQYSAMSLRWLSNSSVTCNDGTRAGYYIRPTPNGSKKWLIFLEGGWYCMSKSACDQRWYKMRDFMTSFRWSQYKTFSGILSSSSSINPYWWNANHVFIPYCSSDIWSGDSSAHPPTEMAFMGSRIIDEVITELIRSPTYQFLNSEFVLLAGSSAGAAGVMINLDRVAKMIADSGSMADVRGLADSGWILDNDQLTAEEVLANKMSKFGSAATAASHQQKFSSCIEPGGGNCSPTETIKGAYKLWNSRVPEACAQRYPTEPWRCYFGYRLYPTLTTPLFVVQFQYDEFQIYMDGMTSRALNDMEKMRYIRFLSQHMISTLANVSAVFAPSCMAHILLTKLDWHKVNIRGVTLPEALNCWEQTPVNHNRFHNRYNQHYRTSFHYQQQQQQQQFPVNSNKFIWNEFNKSINNNRPLNIWMKPTKFQSSSESKLLYKPEYLLPSDHNQAQQQQEDDDQNELLQFYSPSSSSSSAATSNLLNYLTLKHRSNHSTINNVNGYYSQQKMEPKPEIEEKMPRTLWKLNDGFNDTKITDSTSSSSSATNSILINNNQFATNSSQETSFVRSQTSQQQQNIQTNTTGLNKKRKKRKRRKGHHHRKSSPALSTSTIVPPPDSIQNDGYEYSNILSKSLNSYYQSVNGASKRYGQSNDQINNNQQQQAIYWKPMMKDDQDGSEYWTTDHHPHHHHHHHHHSIRICHFRLIDDHQYPERNRECPRLQFSQNTNHHNRDKSSYMEQRR